MDAQAIGVLRRELQREDLQIFSAVRLALRDVRAGQPESAVARLRSDADKLRCFDTPLNALLASQ
jgi:hypothetical protein